MSADNYVDHMISMRHVIIWKFDEPGWRCMDCEVRAEAWELEVMVPEELETFEGPELSYADQPVTRAELANAMRISAEIVEERMYRFANALKMKYPGRPEIPEAMLLSTKAELLLYRETAKQIIGGEDGV